MQRFLLLVIAVVSGVTLFATSTAGHSNHPIDEYGFSTSPYKLSVLTYNVEGLPWPIRAGRTEALRSIGETLRELRSNGRQPHIVVLQEAFTSEAKRIGRDGGYRYIAKGPAQGEDNPGFPTPAEASFAAAGYYLKGEREGKLLDSGLEILSDYPIVSVHEAAFPQYACAGFDCLANKGILLATIAIPGLPTPVAIVAIHMNSRMASGVDSKRANYAYERQVDALDSFLRSKVDPAMPAIVAGDFNAGSAPERMLYLERHSRSWRENMEGDAFHGCFEQPLTCARHLNPDVYYSFRRGRDWQFLLPGRYAALSVERMAVPFGHDSQGAMLSDHVGYTAYYRLAPRSIRTIAVLAGGNRLPHSRTGNRQA